MPILSSDIVRRVQHSPDSVTNLETVVANLILEEMRRDPVPGDDDFWVNASKQIEMQRWKQNKTGQTATHYCLPDQPD